MTDNPRKAIFESAKKIEIIEPSDKLIVADIGLFKDQFQDDSNLCAYLTHAAQVCMCNPNPTIALASEKMIKAGGLKNMAEQIRKSVGETRLESHKSAEMFEEVTGLNPLYGVTVLKEYLGITGNISSTGEIIARGIREKHILPSILIRGEDHVVLGIGTSADGKEIIAWDAKLGKGNPRLRRIPTDKDVLMDVAARINPVFSYK